MAAINDLIAQIENPELLGIYNAGLAAYAEINA